MGVFAPLLLSLLFSQAVSQSYQVHDADSTVLVKADNACLDAFNANVSCLNEVGWLYGNPYQNLDRSILQSLCTDECRSSLRSHRKRVQDSCSRDARYVDGVDGTQYLPTQLDDELVFAHDIACAKKSDGSFCNLWYQQANSDASECDECPLKLAHLQANFEQDADDAAQRRYSSLASSCGVKSSPVTSPAPNAVSSTIAASRTCAGISYRIKPTDTFYSVPRSQQVSTEQLLQVNGLSYNASAFPNTGSLCIENKCDIHVLDKGDTCSNLAAGANITKTQFMSWNLNVNPSCSNLEDFMGHTVCLSNPLGDFKVQGDGDGSAATTAVPTTPAPLPSNVGVNVTSRCGRYYQVAAGDDCSIITLKVGITFHDFQVLNPGIDDTCSNLWLDTSYCVAPVGNIASYSGYTGTATLPFSLPDFTPGPSTKAEWDTSTPTSDPEYPVIPLANETRVDCWRYLWINDTSLGSETTDCWLNAWVFGANKEDFAVWNPSIDQNEPDSETPTFDYDCSLSTSMSYCVQLASPTPDVPTGTKLPTPRASGEIESCTSWSPAIEGLECDVMLSNLELSMADFYEMNPSVKSDCSGLVLGTNYCIFSPDIEVEDLPITRTTSDKPTSTRTTTASTASTTRTGVAPPGPTQSGIPAVCSKYVMQKDGVFCYDMAAAAGISLNELYEYNPALGGDCSGLWGGYAYCIELRPTATSTTASSSCTPRARTEATFNVLVRTAFGESVYVVGDPTELGSWDTSQAVAMNADGYTESNPQWSAKVNFAAGASFGYKYIKMDLDGGVTWENGDNRGLDVPGNCEGTAFTRDTWQ